MLTIASLFYAMCSTCFAESNRVLLILGDSLSAGYGVNPNKSWVSGLSKELAEINVGTVNASISGDTTAAGLNRLPKLLQEHQPKWILIALGSNDGLSGQKLSVMKDNLSKIINLSLENNVKVMMLGFHLPVNYGDYAIEFENSFVEVANEYNGEIQFIPFNLDEFSQNLSNFQSDQIHPTEKAQVVLLNYIADNVIPWVTARESRQRVD